MSTSIVYPLIDFSGIDFSKIQPGAFLMGFDSNNSNVLSKIDHLGNITVIEGSGSGPQGPVGPQGAVGATGATGPVSPEYNFPVFTVELIDNLSVDFYAPFNLQIDTITNLVASPTITLQVNNLAYTLGNSIPIGSKITVTSNIQSVINLNSTRL